MNEVVPSDKPRLACLSIDLDEVPCYCAIYGLDPPPARARWAVYERAVPRYIELLAELNLTATFFMIGRDLSEARVAEMARTLHGAGHELGNHSQDHDYAFSRLPPEAVRRQIELASDAIEGAAGARPVGFRAPGYTLSDTVVSALAAAGMGYDSSVFPCPAYYGLKAAAIAAIAATGHKSHSIVDDPRVLTAPANPYRCGTPYYRRGQGLLELPIGVTRSALGRLPFIGGALTLAGPAGARILTRAMLGRPLVNLELHGIDLAHAGEDGLEFLARHQRDLRVPLARKRATLQAVVATLRAAGYRFETLATAASAFQ